MLEVAVHRAKVRKVFGTKIVEFGSRSQSISTTCRKSQGEHDFAKHVVRLEADEGGAYLVEWENRINDRANEPAVEPGHDLGRKSLGGGDFLVERASAEGRAHDGQPLTEHQVQVERGLAATEQADQHQTALGRDRSQVALECDATEQVDHHVNAQATRRSLDGFGEILPGGVDSVIQTQSLGSLELARRSGGAPDFAAHRMGELDCGRADTAADRVDQDTLAGRNAGLREECVVRGDEGFGDTAAAGEIEIVRDAGDQALVGDHVLSLATAADDSENAVAGLDRSDDIGTEGVDFAGVFEAWNVGGRAGRGGIHTLALQQVSPVQSAGANANADLVAPRLGCGDLANFAGLPGRLWR